MVYIVHSSVLVVLALCDIEFRLSSVYSLGGGANSEGEGTVGTGGKLIQNLMLVFHINF